MKFGVHFMMMEVHIVMDPRETEISETGSSEHDSQLQPINIEPARAAVENRACWWDILLV